MTYKLGEEEITIEIIYKNNKNIYMRFQNDLTLQITCNRFTSTNQIKKLMIENSHALEKMLHQKKKELERNQFFYYLGKPYQIVIDETVKVPTFTQNSIIAKDEKTLKKFYDTECKRIFELELARILPYFSNIPSFTLKMRNMKTRWGVNNYGSKTITLNKELLKKDLDLLDYVIIHELCHFYEPNHSEAFWNHVKEYYPKYKEARKRLRN